MKKTRTAFIVAACIALWVPAARAEAEDTTGAVIVQGAVNREVSVTAKAAAATLNAAGWQIKDVVFTDKETKAAIACLPSDLATGCASATLKSKHVARVAIFSLTLNSATQELVITGRLMVPGVGLVPMGQRFCDHCTDDTLTASTRELLQDLLHQLAVASGRTVLEVITVPAGAMFLVDQKPSGSTNNKVAIAPGEHVLRIEKPGYLTVERHVKGVEGSTTKVEITLEAEDPKHPVAKVAIAGDRKRPTPQAHRSRTAPAALMIIGGVAVVSGAVVLAFNESDPRAAARTEQPRYYTRTIVPGGITIAAGAIAVGVGYFWWRHVSSSTMPVVAPVAGGALFGLAKSF